MIRILTILLTCWFAAGCAISKTGKALDVGVGVAAYADYVTSHHALERGGREANPFLGQPNKEALIAAKTIGALSMIYFADWVENTLKRPTLAHLVRSIVIVSWGGIAIHNHGVMR